MATCLNCGANSRQDPDAITAEWTMLASPLGKHSLSGTQLKVSAQRRLRMSCRCGWKVTGYIDGDQFVADPEMEA